MPFNKRKNRLYFYKLSALLTLVRWYNIFFLALSQYLAVVFILQKPKNWRSILLNIDLHFIVFASLFSVAAGYIINAFYDQEKDLINRPKRTVLEKIIRTSTSLQLYFLFNLVAVLLAFSVSFNVFLFFSGFVFALWIYSHKLKRITFVGNLMASLLSVTPFFTLFIYFQFTDIQVIIYVCFVLLLIFIREIIKDLETLQGDLIIGYKTLPAVLGIQKTKWLIVALAGLGTIPAVALFIITHFKGISYYLVAGGLGTYASLAFLFKAQNHKDFVQLNNLYRLLIIAGIFSLMLFAG